MSEPSGPVKEPGITDEEGPMPEPVVEPEEARGQGVGDLVRRALLAGVGAVFMTEEGIRKSVAELKLPKEAFAYISTQAEKTRSEAGRVLRKEVRRFLNSDRFKQQLGDLLSGLTLEIKAEVRLKPDRKGGQTPEVDAEARIKVKDKDEPAS